MVALDLTDYRDKQKPISSKTIVTYCIRLDKKTILDALSKEFIVINGDYFKVPEKQLLECLSSAEYGAINLELEKYIVSTLS